MTIILKQAHRVALMAALLCVALVPGTAFAQSDLATSEAEAFMGNWQLTLQTDQGPFDMMINLMDEGGQVAAEVGNPQMGGLQDVTDVSVSGEDLMLSYDMNAQGQMVPVSITLTPDGDELSASVDFADGMFIANGMAARADE